MGRKPAIGFLGPALCALLATVALAGAGGLTATAADQDNTPALTGGAVSHRENSNDGARVLFGEDVSAFISLQHENKGRRCGPLTCLPMTNRDIFAGLPSCMVGGEDVHTRNNNRNIANFELNPNVGGGVQENTHLGVTL